MKNRKLLIRVTCTNKDFYLYKPNPGADWHVRFTPPRFVRLALHIRERINRTTGCKHEEAAKQIAARMIEEHWPDRAGRVVAIERGAIKATGGLAKISDIINRYRKAARTVPDKEELSDVTIGKNITSLIRVVSTRFDENGRQRRLDWQCLDASYLTADQLENFKRGWLAGIDRNDFSALASAKHTVNSYIRQARSLFADDYMPLYRDINLPDLTEFKKVRLFGKPGATRFVAIPQPLIDAMETEVRSLRDTRPDLYLAFYFMLWLGMRVREVVNARLEWIDEYGRRPRMNIIRRSYFKPKGIDGSVVIADSIMQDIRDLSGAHFPLDFLIPGPNRQKAVGRELSAIVRRHLGDDRRKTCHELRKQAISMDLMRTKNYVDTLKFSRHSDLRTLRDHYEAYLDDPIPITSSNWREIA